MHARALYSHLCSPGFYHTAEDDKDNEGRRNYYRVCCADSSEDDVVDKLKDMFDKVPFFFCSFGQLYNERVANIGLRSSV